MVEIGLRFILYLLVYKKEDENDMVVVVAQHERNNIKYHASSLQLLVVNLNFCNSSSNIGKYFE